MGAGAFDEPAAAAAACLALISKKFAMFDDAFDLILDCVNLTGYASRRDVTLIWEIKLLPQAVKSGSDQSDCHGLNQPVLAGDRRLSTR